MTYFDQSDDRLLEEAERRRAFVLGYQADPDLAQRTVAQANAYPQNSPGVNLALAKGGIDPQSPVAQEAARLSQRSQARKKSSGGFGGFIGGIGDMVQTGFGGVAHGLKAGVRGLLTGVSAPIEEVFGGLRSVAGQIGGRAGGAVAGAGGGAALGAAAGAPFAGVGALPGAAVGGLVGAIGGFLGGDHIQAEDPGFRWQSSLAQAVGQLDDKGGVDLGSGFLPGGRAREAAEQAKRKSATLDGKGFTLGRLVSGSVLEPGTTPYNVASGIIDFAAAIKLDPVAVGGLKVAQVRAARKTLLGERGKQWLTEPGGVAVQQAMATGRKVDGTPIADFDASSPWAIWNMSKRQLPPEVAVRIANTSDPAEVARILQAEIGGSVRQTFRATETGQAAFPGGEIYQPSVRRVRGKSRLTLDMPKHELDWDDPKGFIEGFESAIAAARVPKEDRVGLLNEAMNAVAGPTAGRQPKILAIQNVMEKTLTGHGMDPTDARRLSRWMNQTDDADRLYTASDVATNPNMPSGMVVNGNGVQIASPTLLSEVLDTPLHLPSRNDWRQIRQDASWLGPLFRSEIPVVVKGKKIPLGNAIRGSEILMNGFLQKVWKVGVLARLAIVPRIGMDEQARMAAAGLDSVFSHPLSYMMRQVSGRGKVGPLGDDVADALEAQKALSGIQQREGFFEQGSRATKNRKIFRAGVDDPADYKGGWLDHELGHLRADPVAQHYAQHGAQATKDWMWNGGGRKFLDEWRANRPNEPNFMASRVDVEVYVDDVLGKRMADFTQGDQRLIDFVAEGVTGAERAARSSGAKIPKNAQAKLKAAREAIDDLDTVGKRPEKVVGDVSVRVGTEAGALYDRAVGWLFSNLLSKPTNVLARSPAFNQFLWNRSEEMVGLLRPQDQRKLLANARKAKLPADQIRRIEEAMTPLVGKTDKELRAIARTLPPAGVATAEDLMSSVAPHVPETGPSGYSQVRTTVEGTPGEIFVYRSEEGRVVGALAVEIGEGGKAATLDVGVLPGHQRQGIATELFERAKRAGLDPEAASGAGGLTPEGAAFALGRRKGVLTLEQLDEVAKGFALEETQTLLYDLAKRNQGLDAARLIFPFAEPWKEMLTTWPKLLRGPVPFLDDPLQALARGASKGRRGQQVIEGARGSGFFKEDPQTGEEMFVYPGSEFISELVTGAPIPLKGRVAGLNLFADNPVMPGFGPLVQIPVSAILPDKPDFDWIQDAVNPFGRSEKGVAEQLFAPAAWMDKVRKAVSDPESDRVFGNAVYDSSRYLVSTGGYDMSSDEDQQRLSKDSVAMARKVYMLRAVGSFAAPASPSPEWKSAIKDKSGRLLTQWELTNAFHEMQEEDYDTAVERFMNLYGEEGLLYMQPKSKLTGGGAATEEQADFARDNPDLVRRFPETYHYFGPQGGEFSMTAYQRQLVTGERESLTPTEARNLAQHSAAQMIWKKAKERVGARPNPQQREWLDTIKGAVLEKYPGWEPDVITIGRTESRIRQLQQAVEDPALAETDVGRGFKLYFAARDKAIESARNLGVADHKQAKKAAPVREWLRGIGAQIADRYPDTAPAFDRIFFAEMKDDIPTGSELPER